MQLPYHRKDAFRQTRHHLLFEKPYWEATPRSRDVRQMGSYIVSVVRAPHDYLHGALKPVPVPSIPVLKVMHEVGHAHQLWHDDNERIDQMLTELVGFATFTSSPQQCHEMLEVTTSIEAQMAVIGLLNHLKVKT